MKAGADRFHTALSPQRNAQLSNLIPGEYLSSSMPDPRGAADITRRLRGAAHQ
jgi:hypothetical protein